MNIRYKIQEHFQITNRGTAVVIDEKTDFPAGKALHALIVSPDGNSFEAEAFKEWILWRNREPLEKEAFLLVGVDKNTLADGSEIEFHIS